MVLFSRFCMATRNYFSFIVYLVLCIFLYFCGLRLLVEKPLIPFLSNHSISGRMALIPRCIIQKSPTKQSSYSNSTFVMLNPNYKYYHFDDKEADQFVRDYLPPTIVQVYLSMPKAILKADFFRYIAIKLLGGVYSDTDTDCVRPIDTWADDLKNVKLIIGIEREHPDELHRPFGAKYLQICMSTFAAAPEHPILRRVVEKSKSIVYIIPFFTVRSTSIVVNREFLRCEALYSSRARTHPQSIICVAMFSTTVHRTNIVQTLSES